MAPEDVTRLENRLEAMEARLTDLMTDRIGAICEDVKELQTTSASRERQIAKLFELTDWIPRLQGGIAVLLALVVPIGVAAIVKLVQK